MTPLFARAVDPVFEYVLELVDRVEHGEEPDPEAAQTILYAKILNRAEQQLMNSTSWQLAKYALVAWIDELLTRLYWSGQDYWINNPLEFRLFQTAERATEFYARAQQALQLANFDALEVYYLCVILEFRGIYESPEENQRNLSDLQLPATLEVWLQRLGNCIRPSPIAPLVPTGRVPPGAPPLRGPAFMKSALVILMAALALVSVFLISNYKWGQQKAANSVQESHSTVGSSTT